MYRVAQAKNSSLKLSSTSVLIEVKLHIQALMPKVLDWDLLLTKAGVSRVELCN